MISVIGEVLIDEFPDYSRIGGAPFNFAANVFRLGETVRLLSRIGEDAAGDRIAAEMSAIGLDASGLQTDPRKATGRVRVITADDGSHRFEILPDVAFDRIQPDAASPFTRLVYFGTLAQRTPGGFDRIQRFIAAQPEGALRMLDINLRPDGYTPEVVTRSLQHADILKLNDEEWDALADLLAPPGLDEEFGSWLMRHFGIGMIALTRGAAGAELLTARCSRYRRGSPPVAKIVDTVGAGDGFAAVLAVGLLRQTPLGRVLDAAVDFAAAVCTIGGALPDDGRLYRAAAAALAGGDNGR